jgi:16S rRNA G1207 methylase RsmC
MSIANWLGPGLLSHVKLNTGTRRLLDVGGGHGLYSIMFCEKYPQLTATIIDRAESLKVARKNIDSRTLGKRIELKIGDMLSDDYGTGYDVAFLINIIHNFREDDNIRILKKTSDALSSGGSIIIFDDFRGPGISKRTVDFFSLAYLITVGGQCYGLRKLKGWLEETGFGGMRTSLGLPGLARAIKFSMHN